MGNVKRNVPIDPPFAEYMAKPTSTVWAADPNLTAIAQHSTNIDQHPARFQRMFEHVRQHRYVKRHFRMKLFQQTSMNCEAGFTRYCRCVGIQLQAFHLKSVRGKYLQAATFVTANVKEPPTSLAQMERHIAVDR